MKSPMFYPFSCFLNRQTQVEQHQLIIKEKQRSIIFIPQFTASCKNTLFLLTWMFCWTFHLFGGGQKLNSVRALSHVSMPWHIQYIRVSQAKRSKCANRRTFMSRKFPDMHYSATYCCYQTLWIEKNVNFTSWQSCEHNGCWSPPQSCWTITDHRINVNAIVCYPAVNAGHCSFKTCFFFSSPRVLIYAI